MKPSCLDNDALEWLNIAVHDQESCIVISGTDKCTVIFAMTLGSNYPYIFQIYLYHTVKAIVTLLVSIIRSMRMRWLTSYAYTVRNLVWINIKSTVSLLSFSTHSQVAAAPAFSHHINVT